MRHNFLTEMPRSVLTMPLYDSPYPYPVQWWEFFIVTGFVVAFSVFMEAYANEFLVANFAAALSWLSGGGVSRKSQKGETVFQVVQSIIRELTYADVTPETRLTEAGLSSMTTIILVSEIKKVYKTLKLTVRDVINSETVGELVGVIEGRMKESAARPELALGNRTGVVASKTLTRLLGDSSMANFNEHASHDNEGGRRSTRTSFVLGSGISSRLIGSGLDDGSVGSQNLRRSSSVRSRRASFKVGTSVHSRRASFKVGTSVHSSTASLRRISLSAGNSTHDRAAKGATRMSFTAHAQQARGLPGARTPSSRMSFVAQNNRSSSRLSGGMDLSSPSSHHHRSGATISTSSLARQSSNRPNRLSSRFLAPQHY